MALEGATDLEDLTGRVKEARNSSWPETGQEVQSATISQSQNTLKPCIGAANTLNSQE